MDVGDYIGLGFLALGAFIFAYNFFMSKRFRRYAGIGEYKKGREDLSTGKPDKEKGEEYVDDSVWHTDSGISIAGILGKLVALFIGFYVLDEVIDTISSTVSATDAYFGSAVTMIKGMVPIIGILFAGGIIYEIATKTDLFNNFKEKKGIEEYKQNRDKLTYEGLERLSKQKGGSS